MLSTMTKIGGGLLIALLFFGLAYMAAGSLYKTDAGGQDQGFVIAVVEEPAAEEPAEEPAGEAPEETATPEETAGADTGSAAEETATETAGEAAAEAAAEATTETAGEAAAEAATETAGETADAPAQEPAAEEPAMVTAAAGDAVAGEKVYKKCKACHKLEDGAKAVGPDLFAIIGRPVASRDYFTYSEPMQALGGVWDVARLDTFLTKPKDLVPGTKMTFPGLRKEADRANLIAYLAAAGE